MEPADPVVTREEPLNLVGVSTALPPRSAPPSERPAAIQALWRGFMPRLNEISHRQGGERYAVIEGDVLHGDGVPVYRAMIAVDSFADVPAWCERFTLAAGRYAVFEHRGPPKDISKTVANIHVKWSKRIAGLFEHDLEVFVYPEAYDATDPGALCR